MRKIKRLIKVLVPSTNDNTQEKEYIRWSYIKPTIKHYKENKYYIIKIKNSFFSEKRYILAQCISHNKNEIIFELVDGVL